MCQNRYGPRRRALSVTQQQVLDALAKVMSPRGVALTNANVLSAIIGHRRQGVLLDQCRCRGGPRLGKRSRAGGSRRARHSRRQRRDDRAHRRAQGRRCAAATAAPPPSPHRHAHGVQPVSAHRPPQSPALADVQAGGNSRHRRRDRGGLRQRRRRQIDHRAQSGARACAISACASACSMPISTGPRCRG